MTSTVPSVRACTYTAAVEHESQCTQMVAAGFDCETWCATLLLTKNRHQNLQNPAEHHACPEAWETTARLVLTARAVL